MTEKPLKVIIAKVGLDGHEMGALLVSKVLAEDGMEVIYTGPRQSCEALVQTATEQEFDVIGLSFLAGSHKEHTAKIIELLQQKGNKLGELVIVLGGVIPPADFGYLKSLGVDAVFGPGTDTRMITSTIRRAAEQKNGRRARLV